MTLPDEFNPWEHLQSTLIQSYNRHVAEEFNDLDDDDNLTVPRSSLRVACRVRDDDSAPMVLTRMLFFYMTVGKAASMQAPLYGMPIQDYASDVKYKPQVTLYFKQDEGSVPSDRQPVRCIVSFRLVGSRWEVITEAELTSLANDIKRIFATGSRYRWSKGELLYTYRHHEHGLNLKIYALNKSTAVNLIQAVYDLIPYSYDSDFLVEHRSERTYPNTPGTVTILGKARRTPVKRPTVFVRFVRATCDIWGLPVPVTLVGFRWQHKNALVFYEP